MPIPALGARLSAWAKRISMAAAASAAFFGAAPATTVTVLAVGDIAVCTHPNDEATATLVDSLPGRIVTLGDHAYPKGATTDFASCYEPSWGRHKARTWPSPGNHEYLTPDAVGYFSYFGARAGDPTKGYYSFNYGDWHFLSLNSMCEKVGGCAPDSPMVQWIRQDLARFPRKCTLAYFHHPLFSSGEHGNSTKMRDAWDALFEGGVDIVLSGHEHNYERFRPQRPDGAYAPNVGITQFVVGTGGVPLRSIGAIQPNSRVRNADTWGVLRLTLRPTDFSWRFVPIAGQNFTDRGTWPCH
jgi:hypothetical protein